jgi:hypothetical protein
MTFAHKTCNMTDVSSETKIIQARLRMIKRFYDIKKETVVDEVVSHARRNLQKIRIGAVTVLLARDERGGKY